MHICGRGIFPVVRMNREDEASNRVLCCRELCELANIP